MPCLTRGEIAERAGVNIETLRYYERRGILVRPPRSDSNYRMYPGSTVRRVRFVKRAQELGFSLTEIKDLLSLRVTSGTHCGDIRDRAQRKLRDTAEKLRALRGMREALIGLISECSGSGPVSECPILDALDSDENRDRGSLPHN